MTERFDHCDACRQWQVAHSRRRGGQPVRCWTCGGPMRRMTGRRWMEMVQRAAAARAEALRR